MCLEALLISVSPRANFLKPPPVPETPTVTRTSGPTFLNSSATASVIGYTVLEPSIVISPERPSEDRFPPKDITVSAKNANRLNWICFKTGLYICEKGRTSCRERVWQYD